MSDAIANMADRLRVERHDVERRMSDGRRRRLRHKLEATHDELEREREARRALADVLENIEGRRRSRGILRLLIVGGAAYLVSKAIKAARVVGFADLGMEAIYEFEVQDMPVTVAVDSSGESVHRTGPREWQARIGKIPVAVE